MSTGIRQPGEFCWINMLTPRPAEAKSFFGSLLGWTFFEIPGLGYGVKVGGRDIGGLFDLQGPNTPSGRPPMIGVMVKVENADTTCERIKSLGGQTGPAFDIGERGRMAVCHDPNGAQFDVWQPKQMHGTDVDRRQHGAPSWFETLTTDVPRATEFYTALFGWAAEVKQIPGWDYTNFKLGDTYVAGMLAIRPEFGSPPPHWGSYFTVNDAESAALQAVELGAQLCVPVRDIPAVGRFCGITSPQGVMFYAIQYER